MLHLHSLTLVMKEKRSIYYLELGEVEPGEGLLTFNQANGGREAEVSGSNLTTELKWLRKMACCKAKKSRMSHGMTHDAC